MDPPWTLRRDDLIAAWRRPSYRAAWQHLVATLDPYELRRDRHEAFVRYALRQGYAVPPTAIDDALPRYRDAARLTLIERLCLGKALYIRDERARLERFIDNGRVDSGRALWQLDGARGYDGKKIALDLLGDRPTSGLHLVANPYGLTWPSQLGTVSVVANEIWGTFAKRKEEENEAWLAERVEPWQRPWLRWAIERYGMQGWHFMDFLAYRHLRGVRVLAQVSESEAFLAVELSPSAKLLSFCEVMESDWDQLRAVPSWWPEFKRWTSRRGVRSSVEEWRRYLVPAATGVDRWIGSDLVNTYHHLRFAVGGWASLSGYDGLVLPPNEVWIFRPSALHPVGREVMTAPPMLGDEIVDFTSLGLPVDADVASQFFAREPDPAEAARTWARVERVWSVVVSAMETLQSSASLAERARAAITVLDALRLLLQALAPFARSIGDDSGRRAEDAARCVPLPGSVAGAPVDLAAGAKVLMDTWSEARRISAADLEPTDRVLAKVGARIEALREMVRVDGYLRPEWQSLMTYGVGQLTQSINELAASHQIAWRPFQETFSTITNMPWGLRCQA